MKGVRLRVVHTRRGRAAPDPLRKGRAARAKRDRLIARRIPLLLLLALLLGSLLVPIAAWAHGRKPSKLEDAALVGDRKLQGPLCLSILPDVSGSMRELAPVRARAVGALATFLRRELRSTDRLAVIPFAGQAKVALPYTEVTALPARVTEGNAPDAAGTYVTPALWRATDPARTQGCAAVAAVAITDALLGDDRSALAGELRKSNLTRLAVLVPDGGGARPEFFRDPQLRSVQTMSFPADDADALGVRYGRLLAELLGQSFTRRHSF